MSILSTFQSLLLRVLQLSVSRNLYRPCRSAQAASSLYPETIEKAGEVGMVKFIDPETTQSLPDVDILLIGGGFPEIYSEALERNKSLRNDLRRFAEGGGDDLC